MVKISDAFDSWKRTALVAPSTVKTYERIVWLLLKHDLATVEDLTRETVARYMDDRLAEGRSRRTVNMDLAAILVVMRHLHRRGEVDAEAVEDLSGLWLEVPRPKPPVALTREQFDKLRAKAPRVATWMRLALEIGAFTGVRFSELQRLEREDFDLEKKTLTVRRKVDASGRGDTKSHKERTVSLCPELLTILKAGLPDAGPVFPARETDRKGTYWPFISRDALQRAFMRLRQKAGIPITCHMLRRTFTTWALREGVPAIEVANALGHSDLTLISRHYYQALGSNYFPAFERLGQAVAPAPGPSPASSAHPARPLAPGREDLAQQLVAAAAETDDAGPLLAAAAALLKKRSARREVRHGRS